MVSGMTNSEILADYDDLEQAISMPAELPRPHD